MAKNGKKNPFSGLIAGIALIVIGSCVLWFNEADAVANIKAVKDVSENVIEISSEAVDPANDGKLVCLSGNFKVLDDYVNDDVFPVETKTAKLRRIVEVYQWEESGDEDSGYSYNKTWSEDLINSSSFHNSSYNNPTIKPYESESFCAQNVELGAFTLSQQQIKELDTDETLTIDASSALPMNYKISGNCITNSADTANPTVGDVRIRYEYNNFTTATVLAVQKGNSFETYTAPNGKTFNRVDDGKMDSQQLIEKITEENNALKWALRAIGAVAVMIGYISLISPLSGIVRFVPLLGGIVGWVLSLAAALVGLAHSLIEIAIAWFVYRPTLSIILLALVAVIITIILVFIKKNKKEDEPVPEVAAT